MEGLLVESSECPYCGNEFPEESKHPAGQTPLFKNQTLQESLASLYTPPYSHSKTAEKEVPKKKPVPPASFREAVPQSINTGTMAIEEEEPKEESRTTFWALFALIVAGNLCTLGLLQFFFSEGGILRLEWDSSYWFLYCLISLPLFYFGLKKANQQKPNEQS